MSVPPEDEKYRVYWERNIARWADLYLDISHGHETLCGPRWFSGLYWATIGRLERRLMAERYARTIEFLDAHVKRGMVLSDIGCGTGIFVVEALKHGASVHAIDFAASAIELTRQNVDRHCPNGVVWYHQIDVQKDALPASDVTLAMGLTPYLTDLSAFLRQTLPKTKLLFCLYVDPDHWANRLRQAAPFLNVRGLRFYSRDDVDGLYARHGWKVKERRDFATGYVDLACGVK
jgi:cyclopropane fatty-acyl-phospholipid synthase-like methyltransferase